MMENDRGMLRGVCWWEAFPWLILVRCVRLALWSRLPFLGAIGALAMLSGWTFLGTIFSGDPQVAAEMEAYDGCPWTALASLIPDRPQAPRTAEFIPRRFDSVLERSAAPVTGTWEQLSRPLRRLFHFGLAQPIASSVAEATANTRVPAEKEAGQTGTSPSSAAPFTFHLLCGLWALAVWGLIGGAMTRVAAVQLAAEQQVGWGEMIRFAMGKWRSFFAAPLLPLVAVLVGVFVLQVLGVLLRANLGVFVMAVAWPLLLAGAFLMALLLLGVVFGWPLMYATISAEGTDSFDALSRSYAYVFQRPLHLLFYVVVAAVLGLLGWLLVSNFTAAMVSLTYWATGLGAGGGGFRLVEGQVQYVFADNEPLRHVGWLGGQIIQFWSEGLKILATGYLYSFFWSASTAVYLLLRYQVDAAELDEVHLEDAGEEPQGLPPIQTDSQGAPVVVDKTPDDQQE